MAHQYRAQGAIRTICTASPRKSWSSLIVGWLSSSKSWPHTFPSIVASWPVECLNEPLALIWPVSLESLAELWEEGDLWDRLKWAEVCPRRLCGLSDGYPDSECGEMWLWYIEGGMYIRLGMLDDIPETVDIDRGTGCCTGGWEGREKRLGTGLESSSPSSD